MPLSHRSSTEFKAPKQSGRFPLHYSSSAYKTQGTDRPCIVRDIEESLREQLQRTNTELNKLQTERDRLENVVKQLKKTVADTVATVAELKSELSDEKKEREKEREKHNDELDQSKADYDALLKTHKSWLRDYTELQTDYDNLLSRYNTAAGTSSASSPLSSPVPDRKEVRPASKDQDDKRKSREDREHRKERNREKSRNRGRDKEREREKREHEEHLIAEKARLSKRFEGRPPITQSNSGSGRRNSVSQWSGSGTRSTSVNPNSRYTSSRAQAAPVVKQAQPNYGSSVPRTPNPLSPTNAYSSGSSGFNDDDSYEDGNYHAYPIPR